MPTPMMNPYLPSWEYVPDAEPHIFDGRVYIYGSHDAAHGDAFCLNDYVCYSAPVDDLGSWRYEGVIYRKNQDPRNADGRMCLYAPDVTRGYDGRYYLYYVLDKLQIVSVAVSDTPAGQYEFWGYVHDNNGGILGERSGDEAQFDPGVLTEGERTYLYTGFCDPNNINRHGPMVTVLGPDMLTILEEPRFIMPSAPYSQGSGYEGHEFFEASSIRKWEDKYIFVYSSIRYCELCYAISEHPTEGFLYGGVVIANNDVGISCYKPAEKPMYYGGNNHGGMIEINGQWYIFYHRQTNGTTYSRQACFEKIHIQSDGHIPQVEMTSCCGAALPGRGTYSAAIACSLTAANEAAYVPGSTGWMDDRFPKITQDGADGQETPCYIKNLRSGATAGFRYFDCRNVHAMTLYVRGVARGHVAVRTAWNGEVLGYICIPESNNIWWPYRGEIEIPDGIHAFYFTFEGTGSLSLRAFELHD